jgi:hypothetical protein
MIYIYTLACYYLTIVLLNASTPLTLQLCPSYLLFFQTNPNLFTSLEIIALLQKGKGITFCEKDSNTNITNVYVFETL